MTLTLENTEVILAQKIVEDIQNLPYVIGLQLLYAESQDEKDAQLRFDLIINLDEAPLAEEETE